MPQAVATGTFASRRTRAARELGVRNASSLLPAPYAYWLARYPGAQNGEAID